MHSSLDQTQSPLHQEAPFPCGHSEQVVAKCSPQLTSERTNKYIVKVYRFESSFKSMSLYSNKSS